MNRIWPLHFLGNAFYFLTPIINLFSVKLVPFHSQHYAMGSTPSTSYDFTLFSFLCFSFCFIQSNLSDLGENLLCGRELWDNKSQELYLRAHLVRCLYFYSLSLSNKERKKKEFGLTLFAYFLVLDKITHQLKQ